MRRREFVKGAAIGFPAIETLAWGIHQGTGIFIMMEAMHSKLND